VLLVAVFTEQVMYLTFKIEFEFSLCMAVNILVLVYLNQLVEVIAETCQLHWLSFYAVNY